jgi:hypothetical protein
VTPEGKVKRNIDRYLNWLKEHHGRLYTHKPVQNGMGAPTLDYVCCFRGRYFVIEAKRPGEFLTKRQQETCNDIAAADGSWFCIDDSELSWETFKFWIGQVLVES